MLWKLTLVDKSNEVLEHCKMEQGTFLILEYYVKVLRFYFCCKYMISKPVYLTKKKRVLKRNQHNTK